MSSKDILLNEILHLDDLSNVKIRFNLMFDGHWNPTDFYKNADHKTMLNGQYWNYSKKKSFKSGQVNLGFIKIEDDLWLLFHVGKVTKDLNILNGMGYEFESFPEYEKYCGRLIIRYKNKSQNMVRLAESVIGDCLIEKILPGKFDNDLFPGYENIDLSWSDLARVIDKETWKAALANQKGVYLITDTSNGKMYVGSAYGENMILGRWKSYISSLHGGNVELKSIDEMHIRENFRYSVLDIFKATTDDKLILKRETWWKTILKTREFGYNSN
ncbi:MAG: GIY-YIG nuclease family protein [Gammaproteobacteria bacterium]|nr:GIY-YIG nuclease family protein [Gammaproteobacteria bacterium]